MGKLLIKNIHTEEEIKEKIKKCEDKKEVIRWIAILIMKINKLTTRATAKLVGFSKEAVRQWVNKYNELGADGLKDGRRNNIGGNIYKSEELLNFLIELLEKEPKDGGLWTGKRLKVCLEKKYKRVIGLSTIYNWLHLLGYSLKVPRPKHKSDKADEQEAFKKNIARSLQ